MVCVLCVLPHKKMALCCKSGGFDPKIVARIRQKMALIHNIFPGTNFSVLLDADGGVL